MVVTYTDHMHPICITALRMWLDGDMAARMFVWYCNMTSSELGAWALALVEVWT